MPRTVPLLDHPCRYCSVEQFEHLCMLVARTVELRLIELYLLEFNFI